MATDDDPMLERFAWWGPEKYPKSNRYFVAAIQLMLAVLILIGMFDFSPGVFRVLCALVLASAAVFNFWKGWRLPLDEPSPPLHT